MRPARCVQCGKPRPEIARDHGDDYCSAECARQTHNVVFKSIHQQKRQADSLKCVACQEWKPDNEFPHNRNNPGRRGRHGLCRPCATNEKRAYRERAQTAR